MDKKHHIADWLEKLQQESWHLELLISGFSIFLLVQANEGLGQISDYVQLHFHLENQARGIFFMFWGILTLSCYALILSLVFHILVRGFWIGTIGLRSVQPKVDFQRLRYAPAFEQRLQQKLSSLDLLLVRLDQVSSAIFSFAFLIIFMLISIAVWSLCISIFIWGVNQILDFFDEEASIYRFIEIISYIIIFSFAIFSLIYAIDTLLIGVIKRSKRLSKVYKWIYILLSTITLSFLYRPIYYHLVSYIGIWQSRLLLNFFILTMIFVPFLRYEHEIFYPDHFVPIKTHSYYYDDIRAEDEIIWNASIPSSVIEGNSVPLFIRYSAGRNKTLLHICDYTPSKKQGLISGIEIGKNGLNMNDPTVKEANPDSLLNCLSSVYEVKVNDSLFADLQYYYLEHPNRGELGLYTVLDIQSFPRGHHLLKIDYKIWREEQDTIVTRNWVTVPFWKE